FTRRPSRQRNQGDVRPTIQFAQLPGVVLSGLDRLFHARVEIRELVFEIPLCVSELLQSFAASRSQVFETCDVILRTIDRPISSSQARDAALEIQHDVRIASARARSIFSRCGSNAFRRSYSWPAASAARCSRSAILRSYFWSDCSPSDARPISACNVKSAWAASPTTCWRWPVLLSNS